MEMDIEHIGSTLIPGLVAKPVNDIMIGVLDMETMEKIARDLLTHEKYIYYQAFNVLAPNRRLFVRLKDENNFNRHENRWSHIHIWIKGTRATGMS